MRWLSLGGEGAASTFGGFLKLACEVVEGHGIHLGGFLVWWLHFSVFCWFWRSHFKRGRFLGSWLGVVAFLVCRGVAL